MKWKLKRAFPHRGKLRHSLWTRALQKAALVALAFATMQFSARAHAQSITCMKKNASPEEIFKTIRKQTGYEFLYNDLMVKKIKSRDLQFKDASVPQVLNTLFDNQPLTYAIVGKTIVVKERTASQETTKTQSPPPIDLTGTVVDSATGNPMLGVTIQVQGTTTGTTSGPDGGFSLTAPDGAVLVVSYLGYDSKLVAVNSQSNLRIALAPSSTGLNEVVVTALGISKEKRALSYAVTQVSGESFQKAKEINLGNALAGKIAGVDATSSSTGPGGSSRVVIRGNGSLNGDNQPLYVINGVPIINANRSNPGTYGGLDGGDGLSSINPDDIESISVLKGGTAAALYGSRAANGVILITTKSGKSRKGIGVELNSTYTWQVPFSLLDWQYQYGSGQRGKAPTTQAEAIADGRLSWGAKLDGSSVIQFDGKSRPYAAQKNNVKNFYNTGKTFSNTVAVTGGNEHANFRFSASNLDNKGIVPNNSLNLKTFSLSAQANLKNKVTFQGDAQYSVQQARNRTFVGDFYRTPNSNVQLIATNVDVRNLAPGYGADGYETPWSDYIYATNPYFAINKFRNNDTKRRFIGSFTMRYNITDYLYARARVGVDHIDFDGKQITPTGVAYENSGDVVSDRGTRNEINAEALLGFNKTFGKFSIDALAGGNQMHHTYGRTGLSSGFLNVPFQYFIGNGATQNFSENYSETAINSLYGSADFGFNGYLYLNFSGRQDWFSTLSTANNHIFYPSVGLSFVLSDAWKSIPSWINYAKVRASWAQVGGGAPSPYGLDLTYTTSAQQYQGQTLMEISNNTIPSDLKPYTSTTYELGLDWKFLNNRLGLDLTLYQRTTTNDIVNASIPLSSGYSSVALNVGEVRNRGIEVLLTGTPVSSPHGFNWDISYNMAYNDNEVLEIAPGLSTLQLPGATTRTLNGGIYHFVGMPFGMIAGNPALRNDQGQIVYNSANGLPIQGPISPLGKGVPPLTMGLTNSFSYNNFSLSFLLGGKFGGSIYSATEAYGTYYGVDKRTVANGVRENGVAVEGVDQDGKPYTATVPAQTYFQGIALSITEDFVTRADFVKLRQVVLGYTLPQKLLAKTPVQSASLSFVARDLFFLYNEAKVIDPSASYNNSNAQGLEDFGVPSARSFGFNLDIKF